MNEENMNQDTDVLAGFTEMANYIANPMDIESGSITNDDIDPETAVDSNPDNKNDINSNDGITNPEDFANHEDLDDLDLDDLDNDDDVDNDDDDSNDLDNDDDISEETEMISPFVDLFTEKLGWEIDDKDKPNDIEGLISFMSNLIDSNSKPKYYSEDVEKLDEYVKNGGDVKNFLKQTIPGIDIDNIDMSKESNQKNVIKEYLKNTNPKYSDEYIDRKINRYEESGVLEDEAEDTIDLLKEYYAEKEQKLLVDQENHSREQLKQQQLFISNVDDTIEKLDNLFGVPVNTAQKKELKDYLLKADAQGRTKYQVNYSKDPITKLIQQGFLDLNGEKFVKKIQTKANNDAVSSFKNRLKNSKKNNRGKDQRRYKSTGGSFDLISQVSSQLV